MAVNHMPALHWLGIPLELWLIVAVARRLRRTRFSGDQVSRIREAAYAIVPSKPVAALLAGEILVVYYALCAWRARPASAPGARSFAVADASGYGLFSTFILIALLFEGVPMHLLLHRWSHTAAWISTAAGLYGVIWIVGLKRSLQLQPMLVDAERLILQIGFLWRVEFPRTQIAGCSRATTGSTPRRKQAGYLALVILNEPQWLIELKEPAIAIGLFGRQKKVTRIGVAVDDTEGFAAALRNVG